MKSWVLTLNWKDTYFDYIISDNTKYLLAIAIHAFNQGFKCSMKYTTIN